MPLGYMKVGMGLKKQKAYFWGRYFFLQSWPDYSDPTVSPTTHLLYSRSTLLHHNRHTFLLHSLSLIISPHAQQPEPPNYTTHHHHPPTPPTTTPSTITRMSTKIQLPPESPTQMSPPKYQVPPSPHLLYSKIRQECAQATQQERAPATQ